MRSESFRRTLKNPTRYSGLGKNASYRSGGWTKGGGKRDREGMNENDEERRADEVLHMTDESISFYRAAGSGPHVYPNYLEIESGDLQACIREDGNGVA